LIIFSKYYTLESVINSVLGEKLVIFIEFKNEILRTYILRMTVKD